MSQETLLKIENLKASIEGKEILKGVNLEIKTGEVHAVMGPNGSGKSTLAYAIMGHPKYEVSSGRVLYRGREIAGLSPDKRAREGIFLGFQYPTAIPGVSVSNFLRAAIKGLRGEEVPVKEFRLKLVAKMAQLGIPKEFLARYVNDGFSGGEKKRCEILQLLVTEPKLAVLDETDSGLDIDALKTVAAGINSFAGPGVGVLLITHYQRLLNYIKPHFVHVIIGGRIVKSGGPELARELEDKGYDWLMEPQPQPLEEVKK
ncbi:MAG TPA: Fe-S cluster assembly ATPase SufC [Planctomycetota bacterium]|nr:Fe-S cluster assembly ATPase SufC [Planctomycetota bacterium]